MNHIITEEKYRKVERKADLWDALVNMAGTFMNGGGQTITLVQDDATREYGIKVGDTAVYKHQRAPRYYYAGSFEAAMARAIAAEPKEDY